MSENANDILDLVDKLYVNFAFAKKTLKNIEEEEKHLVKGGIIT